MGIEDDNATNILNELRSRKDFFTKTTSALKILEYYENSDK